MYHALILKVTSLLLSNMNTSISYCLYARKSSESDERQTMSIDSQIKEMQQLAAKEGLYIKEIRQESHSAKSSGTRPVFVQLLEDIRNGTFDALLTWAPDRLSRNAGDLGMLVDLMDQGRLQQIRTYSQSFSNNPNEKFLLMILCSQAKLENDNRGINVKRGLRTKCEQGWRPSIAPIGYKNIVTNNRIQEIIFDEERAPIIKQMFQRVAEKGHSGRMLKRWLDSLGFTTKRGNTMPLSKIYSTLKNTFYYGEFKFGTQSYKGNHPPLITKELFDKVQMQLIVPPKEYHKKLFPFKSLCKCGSCGGAVIGEEKYKKLKYGGFTKHVYYHCAKTVDFDCEEPYITENELIKQLIAKIDDIRLNKQYLLTQMKLEIERYHSLKSQVFKQEYLNGNLPEHYFLHTPKTTDEDEMIKSYLLHTLQVGTAEERKQVLIAVKNRIILQDKKLIFKS